MNVFYQSEIKDNYLLVTAHGAIWSVEQMMEYIEKVRVDLQKAALKKLLIDESQCHLHIDLGKAVTVVQGGEELDSSSPDLQKAFVCSEMNYALYRHLFGSNKNVKIFTELEDAETWLMSR
ncbi:hypothetical protein [Pseudodesulfovibrio portus]|nr:hypothetical protein [Pseudodesulfovibrio portus]